jgi:hypothetical protein
VIINRHEASKSIINGRETKAQLFQINIPIVNPNAPGATKIPGAVALFGEKFKLILQPPT